MKRQLLKRLLSYARPHMGYLVLALISALISVSMSLYVPILTGGGIDHIVAAGQVDFGALLPYLNAIALVAAASALFQWVMSYCTNQLTHKTVKSIRDDVFRKLEAVPLSYIDATPHGDLISRVVNDIDQISDGLLQGFTQLFSGLVTDRKSVV